MASPTNPPWSLAVPAVGLATLAATWGRDLPALLAVAVGAVLIVAVVTAVHHAEIVAARVGEPFGTLTLAIAVTVIEVALILTLMLTTPDEAETLARDTAYAAVMVILGGVVGLCLLVGTIKHHAQDFKASGASGALSALTVLVVLTLVLPRFTRSTGGGTYTTAQLLVMSAITLALYGVFVFVQTSRHRSYFLPDAPEVSEDDEDEDDSAHEQPSRRTAQASLGLLVACLVVVVGLAKVLSPTLKDIVSTVGAPASTVGVVIAVLVLAPETLAAVRAAAANRLQTSMNLALGSGLASIGLTIPTIAVASLILDVPLELGLTAPEIVMLTLAVFVSGMTVQRGRVTVLQGAIHLSVFGAFLFLAFVP